MYAPLGLNELSTITDQGHMPYPAMPNNSNPGCTTVCSGKIVEKYDFFFFFAANQSEAMLENNH